MSSGGFGVGTNVEIARRLRALRNRTAGGITAGLREAAADSRNWDSTTDPALVHERACLEAARDLLLQAAPTRESKDERIHRRDAERFYEEQECDSPPRRMLKEHLELAR
jgi:hypothetical protein